VCARSFGGESARSDDDFFSAVFHYRSVYLSPAKSTRDFIYILQVGKQQIFIIFTSIRVCLEVFLSLNEEFESVWDDYRCLSIICMIVLESSVTFIPSFISFVLNVVSFVLYLH
jgi:hypothetical protein